MNEYQGTFQRVEKKYLLDRSQYEALRLKLQSRMRPDRYGLSTVCNIYYDTPDHRLVRTSMEKPIYKEKLRLRSYGPAEAASPAFVELKKKYKGIVYKRRVCMPYRQAVDYLAGTASPTQPNQITKEIDWFQHFYSTLAPAMILSYSRTALFCEEDPCLRVTFDQNILWREEALSLDRGIWGEPLLTPGQTLMEIKIPGAMPLWLAHALEKLQIFPTSYSKYGTAYQNSQLSSTVTRKGGAFCA